MTTTTAAIKMGFDTIEINLVSFNFNFNKNFPQKNSARFQV